MLFVAALVGLGTPLSGCGKQGEGEPCSRTNGNDDCDSAYVCTKSDTLRDPSVDRCCPPQGQPITDSRCTPAGPVNNTDAGTGGTGGTGGTTDAGDAAPEGGGSGGTGGTSGTGGTAGTGGSAGSGAHDAASG